MVSTTRGHALRVVISTAIAIAVFVFVLPQLADFSQVWAAITDMSWLEVVTLVVAAAWNIFTYQLVMVSVLPGLRLSQAFVVGQTSTAVSASLPAGSAIGVGVTYAMYSSMGRSGPEVALATVLTGLWNNFVKLGLPIVALAVLALTGAATGSQLGVSLIGVALLLGVVGVFGAMLSSAGLARHVGSAGAATVAPLRRAIRRPAVVGWGDAAVRFRADTIHLLRRRWVALTGATIVSHVSLFLVLVLALRHMGVTSATVTWAEALVVFAIVRLITVLPVTPGGLGITELALTGALALAGGARNPVVAAVLVFRFLTLIVQLLIGGGCYLYWQSSNATTSRSHGPESARAHR